MGSWFFSAQAMEPQQKGDPLPGPEFLKQREIQSLPSPFIQAGANLGRVVPALVRGHPSEPLPSPASTLPPV